VKVDDLTQQVFGHDEEEYLGFMSILKVSENMQGYDAIHIVIPNAARKTVPSFPNIKCRNDSDLSH
jgi:hypothetical protein